MSSGMIKVGTMVLVVVGAAKGRVGVVIGHGGRPQPHWTAGSGGVHIVEFPAAVPSKSLFGPSWGTVLACRRSHLVPLTPPGEPETLIEESPVRDEVPA